jgi:hypothetical protein
MFCGPACGISLHSLLEGDEQGWLFLQLSPRKTKFLIHCIQGVVAKLQKI